ncbi:MAG: F0F1 ATP synthase subunit delta [Cryobacterium sp.]|nr:F0F1 ATP synthase subunit delta [Cryobacterium sp.]
MGSASRNAIASARELLATLGLTSRVGEDLLSACRVVADSQQLQNILADPAFGDSEKKKLVETVFKSLDEKSRLLLTRLSSSRWSIKSDLVSGIEELGLRSIAKSTGAGTDIPKELFKIGQLIGSNGELELAVGSKLGDPNAKAKLVEKLFSGKASKETMAIVTHLVRSPRGRRIGALVKYASSIVADESALKIATVTVAAELNAKQVAQLQKSLATNYGDLRIQQVIDPGVIGGFRINIGNIVIDETIATRLKDLKLQLVG